MPTYDGRFTFHNAFQQYKDIFSDSAFRKSSYDNSLGDAYFITTLKAVNSVPVELPLCGEK